jgi:hypothetical protein
VFSFEQTLHLLMLNIVAGNKCRIERGRTVLHMKRWLGLYKAALLEMDAQKMPKRIVVARTALQERLRNLQSGSGNYEEELEIDYAFRNLCVAERMAGMEAKRR